MKDSSAIRAKIAKRIEHTIKRGQELGSAIRDWGASNAVGQESHIAPDRLSWELTLTISVQPALEEWNYTFGETMHHLRSTLNGLLAQIAHAEDIEAGKQLQFPISTSRAAWNKDRSKLKGMPSNVIHAIEQLQPFHRPDFDGSPANQDPLAILAELSNQDKHRMELVPDITLTEISHDLSLEFEVEPGEDLKDVMERMVLDTTFANGVNAIRHNTSPYRIKQVIGRVEWRGRVIVKTDSGNTYGPADVLNVLIPYVTNTVDHVLAAWERDLDTRNSDETR